MKFEELLPRRELLFGKLVLIYQMPKVGSQTIEATLRQCSVPDQILRFHYLSNAMASNAKGGLDSDVPDKAWKQKARPQLELSEKIARAIRLRKILSRCGFNIPKLQVITGVRELIGLVLASIFENYLYFAPDLESMTVETCRDVLLRPRMFIALRDWFNLELKSFIGIDVYQRAFPREKGFAIYENRFARALVYRFEALPNLPAMLLEFLNLQAPELTNRNVGASKQYGDRYRSVKEQLRLPRDFVTSLYDCQMMRHFYSIEEREHWRAKWSQPVGAPIQTIHPEVIPQS